MQNPAGRRTFRSKRYNKNDGMMTRSVDGKEVWGVLSTRNSHGARGSPEKKQKKTRLGR